mmetsp:Transcript_110203/g.351235  ORF Transcript_110203/g.351235 Transcript_110203/m.351235 type:complete len:223 (+) Transcript_110203:1355-2023(+)
MPNSRSHCTAPESGGEAQQLDALLHILQRLRSRPKFASGRAPEHLRRTPGLFLRGGLPRPEPPDRDHRFSGGSLIRSLPANCRQPVGMSQNEVTGAKLHYQHLSHKELFSRGGLPRPQPPDQDHRFRVGNCIRSLPANCRQPLGMLHKDVCGAKVHYRHWSRQGLFSRKFGEAAASRPTVSVQSRQLNSAVCRLLADRHLALSASRAVTHGAGMDGATRTRI